LCARRASRPESWRATFCLLCVIVVDRIPMSAFSHDLGPKCVAAPHELHGEVFYSSRRIAPADWLQCAELCTDSRIRDSQRRLAGAILRYPPRVRDRQADSQLPGQDYGHRTHGRTLIRYAAARREIVPPTPRTVAFLRDAAASTRRIASICIGAFTLAEAGLIDGRRATTHWAYAQELQQRFPKVKVEMDRIFIADGPIWTSAGMTAGIDLALGLIERDLGQDVARATARTMVVYHRRAGGQSQHSAMLELDAKSDRVHADHPLSRSLLRTN
jgi:DJ-1/PfpI family